MPALPIPDGYPNSFALDICLLARINFTKAWTAERRHALVTCLREYAELCGDQLYLQDVPTSSKVVRFKPSVFDRLDKWIDKAEPMDVLECTLTSAREDVLGPAHYAIMGLAINQKAEDEGDFGPQSRALGTLEFVVPWFWHNSQPKTSFSELVWRCANRLQAHSGWAGLGFAKDGGFSARHRFEPLINRIAHRWPVLLLDNSPYDTRNLRTRIREPGWITLVGDQFLAELGGEASVSDRLPHPIEVRPYQGGLLVQAGPDFPLTSDITHDSPIIAALERRLADPPEGTWLDNRTVHRWIARFDNPSPWPSPWEAGEPSIHLNLSGVPNADLIEMLAKLRKQPH